MNAILDFLLNFVIGFVGMFTIGTIAIYGYRFFQKNRKHTFGLIICKKCGLATGQYHENVAFRDFKYNTNPVTCPHCKTVIASKDVAYTNDFVLRPTKVKTYIKG